MAARSAGRVRDLGVVRYERDALPEITIASDDAQRLRAQVRSQGRSPRRQAGPDSD